MVLAKAPGSESAQLLRMQYGFPRPSYVLFGFFFGMGIILAPACSESEGVLVDFDEYSFMTTHQAKQQSILQRQKQGCGAEAQGKTWSPPGRAHAVFATTL